MPRNTTSRARSITESPINSTLYYAPLVEANGYGGEIVSGYSGETVSEVSECWDEVADPVYDPNSDRVYVDSPVRIRTGETVGAQASTNTRIVDIRAAESPISSYYTDCRSNLRNATELYKHLILKHCEDFVKDQYLGLNLTQATLDVINNQLTELTRELPYKVCASLTSNHFHGNETLTYLSPTSTATSYTPTLTLVLVPVSDTSLGPYNVLNVNISR